MASESREPKAKMKMKGETMTTKSKTAYPVRVTDSNPNDSSVVWWGDEFTLRATEPVWGESSRKWFNDNIAEIRTLESKIRKAAKDCGEYSKGDFLWWQAASDSCGVMQFRMTI